MDEKRDSTNRYQGIVVLPITSDLPIGTVAELRDIEEQAIDCMVRDAMAMEDPINGDAVGDAIFDAQNASGSCDADS